MFGIGPMELVIIALFAVIFIGPQKLPEVMRQFGRFFVQARRYSNDLKGQIQTVIDQAEHELRMEELEKLRAQLKALNPEKAAEEILKDPIEQQAAPAAETPVLSSPTASAPTTLDLPHSSEPALNQSTSTPATGHFDDPHLTGLGQSVDSTTSQTNKLPNASETTPGVLKDDLKKP